MNSEIILVFGRRGSGKTVFCKQNLIPDMKRVIIFDPHKEYVKEGMQIVDYNLFSNVVLKMRFNPYLKICYYPEEEDIKFIFSTVCKMIYELGDINFIIEEVGRFVTALSFPISFDKLIRGSRHRNVNIIGITQRATDVPRIVRSQATKIISFQQIEPKDIKYLSEFLDNDTVEKVRQFNQFEYLEYDSTGKIEFKKLTTTFSKEETA